MTNSPADATPQIVGYAQTPFCRSEGSSLTNLAVDAASGALLSAGVAATQVDALFLGTFASLALGHQAFPAAVLAARLGLGAIPALAVEGACASGSLALRQAIVAVEAGTADVALVVGAERMSGNSTSSVTNVLARATDTYSDGFQAGLTFPGFFGLLGQRYLHEYDVDRELLADVSVKNRANGARNPKAHFQQPILREEAIHARAVAEPLRLYDCSPISDGAAAVVVASRAWASAHHVRNPVDVLAIRQAGGPVSAECMSTFISLPAAVAAAEAAYVDAGITASDVDVAEVHDCFSIAEWIAIEDLGLVPRGEGAAFTSEGETLVSGSIPVNPSGGLLSKGHPVGATGIAQVVEIVRQLRGEADSQVTGANIGITHNVGGTGGVAVVSILGTTS